MKSSNITPDYTDMCTWATEIQELWKPTKGDLCKHMGYRNDVTGLVVDIGGIKDDKVLIYDGSASQTNKDYNYKNVKEFNKTDCIWLPSQAQLQQILDESLHTGKISSNYFVGKTINAIWGTDKSNSYLANAHSWEELWLMMVMQEKFNKRWNWIKKIWVGLEDHAKSFEE